MMRTAYPFVIAFSLGLSTPCFAGKQAISPELRQQAVQLCTGDAMRLCLASLMDEEQTTQCMSANRTQLSPSCRQVFDAGRRGHRH